MNEAEPVRCPACNSTDTRAVRIQTAVGAAEHFVPRARDPQRHRRLLDHVAELWGHTTAHIMDCNACGFGFVAPFVGGDAEFYRLLDEGDPHYPSDRWEFSETLKSLRESPTNDALVLEVGAGKGAFVERLVEQAPTVTVVATDFDERAVAMMRRKGIDAHLGTLADVAGRGPFDAICLFHTLEHLSDLDQVFRALGDALTETGAVFISVPNADWTRLREDLTGFLDMPPLHVGRWTAHAFCGVATLYGFRVVEQRASKETRVATAWELAQGRVMGDAYAAGTLAHRLNSISVRTIRGVAKRALAAAYFGAFLIKRRDFVPMVRWVHLQRLPAASRNASPRPQDTVMN